MSKVQATNNNNQNSDTPTKKTQHSLLKDVLDLVFCAGGIYVCYIGYGIIQERIYKTTYGPAKEKFKHSLFLVFLQCVGNGLVGLISMLLSSAPRAKVPMKEFFYIGFTYIGAMFSTNYSLNYVSYPTQALAKSSKIIPVMLMRIFFVNQRYDIREYLNMLMTTTGIAVFMLFESPEKLADSKASSWIGIGLLALSLFLDGFTGPNQERVIEKYKPSTQQMMTYMNFFAVLLVGAALVVTQSLMPAIEFCQRFPEVLIEIVLFSLASAIGQNFVLHTVFRFNSLIVTTITTTRKFFTILASVLWFGHHLNLTQWLGVAMVFSGLGMDIVQKYYQRKQKHKDMIHSELKQK